MSEEPLDDLDALIRRVDEDRWLSSRYVADPQKRADLIALYAYDWEITRAPRVVSTPLLGEIRLAWWREALDAIYAPGPLRRHPVVEALAGAIRRHDLPRALLEAALDARYDDLEPQPFADEAALNAWLDAAYGSIMAAAMRVLGASSNACRAASSARAWGLSRVPPSRLPDTVQANAGVGRHLATARAELRASSAETFPAVAHAALAPHAVASALSRRLRLARAVLTGRP